MGLGRDVNSVQLDFMEMLPTILSHSVLLVTATTKARYPLLVIILPIPSLVMVRASVLA